MVDGLFRKATRFRRSSQDPDVIAFKHGGGWQILFGFPFVIVGILAILTCVGLLPLEGEGGEGAIMAAGFFGIVFTAVGVVLLFGRSGVIIDRRRGEVVQWRGLVVPFEWRARALERFDRIRLEIRRDERGASYPVLLRGGDPAETIIVEQTGDYLRARRTAENLALFLGKQLEDLSLVIAGFR
jgi:hypothetical protein